jgi:uncharacterized protein (TIGR00299 family) protein
MKTLYLDIFSGISGDMFIGALLDLGVDFAAFEAELRKLNLRGYHLHHQRAERSRIAGTQFDVHDLSQSEDPLGRGAHAEPSAAHLHHHPAHTHADGTVHSATPAEHRTFGTIRDLILRSELSPWVRQRAVAVFGRVAQAEGKVHGLPAEQVHFHEVGAIDSIVDIVGACIALELLDKPRVLSGPVVEGTGFLSCAHGRYPLPGPATLAILGARSIPITQCEEPHELVTPTGAALLAEFAESFAPMQSLSAEAIGFGLGTRHNQTRPNVLRVILGQSAGTASTSLDWESDSVVVLETNVDDTSAEVLGHFVDRALAQGALDVFHTPVQMKKSRPGVLLTVLCPPELADTLTELTLRETSAFGVRRTLADRRKLRREFVEAETPWGPVRVKLGRLNGQIVQASPEYEDCRRLANDANVPIKNLFEAAIRSHNRTAKPGTR